MNTRGGRFNAGLPQVIMLLYRLSTHINKGEGGLNSGLPQV